MSRTTMLAAVAVAILGGVLYALHLRHFEAKESGGELVSVVVVLAEIQEEEPITRAALGFRSVPRRFVEDRHVKAGQLDRVLGIPATRTLRPGFWVNWNDVGANAREETNLSDTVQDGLRAFTIEVESWTLGKMVAAGDKVDVLITARRPGGATRLTTVLLQNLLVLAVGARRTSLNTGRGDGDTQQSGRNNRFVTLAVNLQEATALYHALSFAERLHLVVRNPDDAELMRDVPMTTDTDLIEAERRAMIQFRRVFQQQQETQPAIDRVD